MLNKSSLITNICFAIDNCFPHQKVSGYMRVVVAQNVCAFSFVHSAIVVVVVIVLMRVPRVSECVYAGGTCDFVVHLQSSCARFVGICSRIYSVLMTDCVQNCSYAIQSNFARSNHNPHSLILHQFSQSQQTNNRVLSIST